MKKIIRILVALCLAAAMAFAAGCDAIGGEAVQEFLENETVQKAIEAAKAPAQDAVQKGIEAISSYVDAAKGMDWEHIAELAGQPASEMLDLLQSKALGYFEDAQEYLGADRSGYDGYYEDIVGNRAAMWVAGENGSYHVDISWPVTNDSVECWSLNCTESESGTLTYTAGIHSKRILDGISDEEILSEEEAGTLRFAEGIAVWIREGEEEPSCLFLIQSEDHPIEGTWEDLDSERAYMEITANGSEADMYDIVIIWGDSAFESEVWTMTAKWDADSRSLIYDNCARMTVTAADAAGETFTQNVQYTGGTGRLVFDGVNLIWADDADTTGADCVFSFGA